MPDSNHTSRMSLSFSNFSELQYSHFVPGGRKSTGSRMNHESAPSLSIITRIASSESGVMSSFPQSRQYRTGSGTPQALCRDMHQSGRFSTMLPMRLMVQSGICLLYTSDAADD